MQKKDTGQILLDNVFKHLGLHEKDYFGLQFASVVPSISDAVVSIHLTDEKLVCVMHTLINTVITKSFAVIPTD